MGKEHLYQLTIEWTGNLGQGTTDYRSYDRAYRVIVQGKPELLGSSDPAFRGDATRWNPEELLLASLSACHMLWYLHVCSVHKIIVTDYQDLPTALMVVEASGEGYIKEATLNPKITLANPEKNEEALGLHEEAHRKCFIANSINFPVHIAPKFQ